jgi:hypothetical protein
MKKLVLAGLASSLIGLAAAPATAAASRQCGNMGTAVGAIRATNTTCSIARKVVRADIQGKRYGGFKCNSRRNPAGANVTCRNGRKKVTFQVAD